MWSVTSFRTLAMTSSWKFQSHPWVTLTTIGWDEGPCRYFHHLKTSQRATEFIPIPCCCALVVSPANRNRGQEMMSQTLRTRHSCIFQNVHLTCTLTNDIISSELGYRVQLYDFSHIPETQHWITNCGLAFILSLSRRPLLLCFQFPLCLAFSITFELKSS